MLTPLHCTRVLLLALLLPASNSLAQQPLGDGPWYIASASPALDIRVSVVARGIAHPWGMAFLPSGNLLVAERGGQFQLVHPDNGEVLPVSGAPAVAEAAGGGLMDIALHPEFATNRLVYFSYAKPGEAPADSDYYATTALARGQLSEDERHLTAVEDIFVAEAWSTAPGGHGSRLLFSSKDTLFLSSPFRRNDEGPQNPRSHIGKLLRLNSDGSIPADNPFVNDPSYLPAIWSVGHRTVEGLTFHPESGALWASEHGPQGGDEINIIQAGANYGWPEVSYGRQYDGSRDGLSVWAPGMEQPHLFWVPSIATSGMMFYTGERFPAWRNHLFVGALMSARMPGTGHIQRIEFSEHGELRRESLLRELGQRIRDVRQGPDGLIYVLTESADGALLVLEPANP